MWNDDCDACFHFQAVLDLVSAICFSQFPLGQHVLFKVTV